MGLFKSDRENDVLSGALSNAEHTGCICGVAFLDVVESWFSKLCLELQEA
jgi:hypothetical protein